MVVIFSFQGLILQQYQTYLKIILYLYCIMKYVPL